MSSPAPADGEVTIDPLVIESIWLLAHYADRLGVSFLEATRPEWFGDDDLCRLLARIAMGEPAGDVLVDAPEAIANAVRGVIMEEDRYAPSDVERALGEVLARQELRWISANISYANGSRQELQLRRRELRRKLMGF